MDTDNSNSASQSERDKINKHLDELRLSQQKRNTNKSRSCWNRLLGLLGAVGSMFFLWGTTCKPVVTCYRRAPDPADEEETTNKENDGEDVMCYCPAYVDENGVPAPVPENLEVELAQRKLNQESEKVKQESPLNIADSNLHDQDSQPDNTDRSDNANSDRLFRIVDMLKTQRYNSFRLQ